MKDFFSFLLPFASHIAIGIVIGWVWRGRLEDRRYKNYVKQCSAHYQELNNMLRQASDELGEVEKKLAESKRNEVQG